MYACMRARMSVVHNKDKTSRRHNFSLLCVLKRKMHTLHVSVLLRQSSGVNNNSNNRNHLIKYTSKFYRVRSHRCHSIKYTIISQYLLLHVGIKG
jgi:hypothetical protein